MFWRGVWGYLPANIVQGAVGFLTIVLFTRMLSPEEFGRYALAFSIMTLIHVALFSWLEAAMARFWAAQTPGAGLRAHFATLYAAAFAVSGAFVVAATVVLWAWPMAPAFRWTLAAGLAGVPVRCLVKLAQERFRAEGQVSRAAGLDMFTAAAGLITGVGYAALGAGAAAPLLGILTAPLLALPLVLPGELREARGAKWERERLLGYARYGYPIAASLALSVTLASTDRFLLAAFLNEAAVGAYHAGYSIANRTLDVLFIWLGAAGTPAMIMALERGGPAKLHEAAREQAGLFALIGFPAAAGVALVARPLAEVMIGEELRAVAATVTPWIALSALLYGLQAYYFGQAFVLGRRTGRLLAAMTVPAGLNIVLNLLLVPAYGVQGAAWATAASFSVGIATFIVLGRRVLVLPIPWEAVVRCGVATAIMAAVVWILPAWGGMAELILDAGVGAVVYAAAALTVNAAGVRDTLVRLIAARRADGATA